MHCCPALDDCVDDLRDRCTACAVASKPFVPFQLSGRVLLLPSNVVVGVLFPVPSAACWVMVIYDAKTNLSLLVSTFATSFLTQKIRLIQISQLVVLQNRCLLSDP